MKGACKSFTIGSTPAVPPTRPPEAAQARTSHREDDGREENDKADAKDEQKQGPTPTLVLILSSIIMFGLYYLISMPASVRQHLKESMPIDNFEARFQLLFTLAHLPGVFLPFLAGIAEDRMGGPICLLGLSATCLVGALVSAVGVQHETWGIVILGRFIFGVGFESLFVANEAFLATWFDEQDIGMALGVSSAASYIGYLLSFILSPLVANRVSITGSFWSAAVIKCCGTLAALLLYWKCRCREENPNGPSVTSHHRATRVDDVSKKGVTIKKCNDETPEIDSETADIQSIADNKRVSHSGMFPQLSTFGVPMWLLCFSCLLQYSITVPFINISSGLLLERNLFVEPSSECQLARPSQCASGFMAPSQGNPWLGNTCHRGDKYAPVLPSSLNLTQMEDYNFNKKEYIFDQLSRSDIDCSDNFWAEACTQDYCDQQQEATELAGIYSSCPFMITVLSTFLMGRFLVDRAGLRAEMLTMAPALVAVAHGMLAFSNGTPLMPLVFMGFGYSIAVTALWPSVPLLVSEEMVGAAFGLMTCVQNVGLSLFPLIVAAIYNRNGVYLPAVEVFFMACSIMAVLLGAALWTVDRHYCGGRLWYRVTSEQATTTQ